jgi:ABC-type bacteriocin/lantibiotic exporter with double-glycine peptidase domain
MLTLSSAGSGKSTLLQSLLRLAAYQQGQISLGGVDLATISIERLRTFFVTVLQDACLFSGTVVENIMGPTLSSARDPSVLSSDDRLHTYLVALNGIAHDASNRAAAPRVLLCDEPTANLDYSTDAKIHELMLSVPATVLCICHRLQYIHQFDYVAVIDAGVCVGFGPPAMLAQSNASFQQLLTVASTGASGGPGP